MVVRILGLAILLIGPLPAGSAAAPPAGAWTGAAPLVSITGPNVAFPLPTGQVLVAGTAATAQGQVSTLDRYDPATGQWTALGPWINARSGYVTAVLRDGRVLAAGGLDKDGHFTGAAALYNPSTNTWTPIPPLGAPRWGGTATLLPNGQVLVVGGVGDNGKGANALVTTERYDPATNTWTLLAPMGTPRYGHRATLLANGQVLVTGGRGGIPGPGALASAERYDPATNTWTPAASMATARNEGFALRLTGGQVLVLGGGGGTDGSTPLASAERYDPATDRWTAAGSLATTRDGAQATLLADGQVLVTGGSYRTGTTGGTIITGLATAERYDPATNRWTPAATMQTGRWGHSATLLPNGQVLVAGGEQLYAKIPYLLNSAELYSGPAAPECFPQTGQCMGELFAAYWHAHGGLAINGYPISGEFQEKLEDGQTYTVQYFERVRMEFHVRNAPPFDVLLGQFGRRIHPADPPMPPQPGAAYFAPTGHNVSGAFLAYWQAHGGLAQFGYPISEPFREQVEDGHTYTVQYFERARFEQHPENRPPYDVLLGLFGRRMLPDP
jgi:N-acetylneuraminic acid mutarotase